MESFQSFLQEIKQNNKKILIVGLGISGIETARYLNRVGIAVVAIEKEDEASYRKTSKHLALFSELLPPQFEPHFDVDGEKVREFLADVALTVLSPGVSLESAIVGTLRRAKIPMISELELGVELMGLDAIVVTGSNGKSTTVNLIHAMLESAGMHPRLCGNIGTPVISEVVFDGLDRKNESPNGVLVVEASSYQLESCDRIHPKVAVLLNISDNHLERHGTIERYFATKAKLFEKQSATDFAVLNVDDPRVASLVGKIKAQCVPCGLGVDLATVSHGAQIRYDLSSGVDFIRVKLPGEEQDYPISGTALLGVHNRYNIACSILVARLMGVSRDSVQTVIETFKPLEHRLEFLKCAGRLVVNDSKSTTVAAAVAAFRAISEAFPQNRIVPLVGGLSKAGSWTPLMALLNERRPRLGTVICFGKDARILGHHCSTHSILYKIAANLESAVRMALSESAPEDILLLSPGCASFDEFRDFEERGNVFKSMLNEIHSP